jgi:flagellin
MRINQNISAFNAFRNLTKAGNEQGKSMERLSSGLRINRASDDAAGLVRSESIRTEASGAQQALQNAQDGISLIQTAEGALNEVQAILQRMRTVAINAGNTGLTSGTEEQAELAELRSELVAISQRTTFGGIQVLDDHTSTPIVFHIGANGGTAEQLKIDIDLAITPTSMLGVDLSTIDLEVAPDAAIATLDAALDATSTARANLGARQNRLEHAMDASQVAQENLNASESRIRDTDMALELVELTRHQVMTQASTAMLAQANQTPESVLALLQ